MRQEMWVELYRCVHADSQGAGCVGVAVGLEVAGLPVAWVLHDASQHVVAHARAIEPPRQQNPGSKNPYCPQVMSVSGAQPAVGG